MPDVFTLEKRRKIMGAIRGKDTTPELLVRRTIFAMGYRYRLHAKDLPGKPDLVFRSRRKLIFVHGCFWHRHSCSRGKSNPQSREEFWKKKLEANRLRDRKTRKELQRKGWRVLVVWECQLKHEERLRRSIARFLCSNC